MILLVAKKQTTMFGWWTQWTSDLSLNFTFKCCYLDL